MQAMRRRVRDMVEGDIDTWFEYSLLMVIFVNVLALVVSSIRIPGEGDWCAPAVTLDMAHAADCGLVRSPPRHCTCPIGDAALMACVMLQNVKTFGEMCHAGVRCAAKDPTASV